MNKREIFARILNVVSEETEIPASCILSGDKTREVVDARHMLANVLYENGFYPSQIAAMTGKTKRAITYAITNFGDRIRCEKILRSNYENIRKSLGN